MGEKLVLARKLKKRFKSVDKKMTEFRKRMQWLIEYRKEEWPYEYGYWKKHRGLP